MCSFFGAGRRGDTRGCGACRRSLAGLSVLALLLLLLFGSAGAVALSLPTLPAVGEMRSSSIAAGDGHYLALSAAGPVYGWARNDSGQVGNDSFDTAPTPVQAGASSEWATLAAGDAHSVALRGDGTLWAWGDNYDAQLGDGTTQDSAVPKQIGDDDTWVSVASGNKHTLALKSDGSLWAWGDNGHGQLGDGTEVDRSTPKLVDDGSEARWVCVTAGVFFSLGIKEDGTLWSWGFNSQGQLGIGSTVDVSAPTQVGTDDAWVAVSAGFLHSLGLKADGSLWAWGNNISGRLGDGTTTSRLSPVQVGAERSWAAVAAGWYHSLAISSAGSLWAWGDNTDGELGDGTFATHLLPTQIGTASDWLAVAAGSSQSLGLKSGGALYSWGWNVDGLGDGSSDISGSPLLVLTGVLVPGSGSSGDELTVTASVSGGGGMVSPSMQTVSPGASASIDVTPDTGMCLAWVKVDGVYLDAPADPIVISDVDADHVVEVGFQHAHNDVDLVTGWNMVAGGPGSLPADRQVFYYTTSGYAVSAASELVAGLGYWTYADASESMQLGTTPLPLAIELHQGWNLVGNSTGLALAVPEGLTAFVWNSGYSVVEQLQPGQAAWIHSNLVQNLTLQP